MQDLHYELIYEEKMDRIAGELEELMLDALLAALRKLRERNELFQRLEQSPPKSSQDF
jgi:Lon protease-like protein